jgi:hypothetical protein
VPDGAKAKLMSHVSDVKVQQWHNLATGGSGTEQTVIRAGCSEPSTSMRSLIKAIWRWIKRGFEFEAGSHHGDDMW